MSLSKPHYKKKIKSYHFAWSRRPHYKKLKLPSRPHDIKRRSSLSRKTYPILKKIKHKKKENFNGMNFLLLETWGKVLHIGILRKEVNDIPFLAVPQCYEGHPSLKGWSNCSRPQGRDSSFDSGISWAWWKQVDWVLGKLLVTIYQGPILLHGSNSFLLGLSSLLSS